LALEDQVVVVVLGLTELIQYLIPSHLLEVVAEVIVSITAKLGVLEVVEVMVVPQVLLHLAALVPHHKAIMVEPVHQHLMVVEVVVEVLVE